MDLLDDPTIISAMDEDTEFNALVCYTFEFFENFLDTFDIHDDEVRSSAAKVIGIMSQFPIRETTTKTIERLLYFQVGKEGNICSQLMQLLILASQDESSEVRRRALSSIKAYAKVNPSTVASSLSILGPAIADSLKDVSGLVSLICEEGFDLGALCVEKSIMDLKIIKWQSWEQHFRSMIESLRDMV